MVTLLLLAQLQLHPRPGALKRQNTGQLSIAAPHLQLLLQSLYLHAVVGQRGKEEKGGNRGEEKGENKRKNEEY